MGLGRSVVFDPEQSVFCHVEGFQCHCEWNFEACLPGHHLSVNDVAQSDFSEHSSTQIIDVFNRLFPKQKTDRPAGLFFSCSLFSAQLCHQGVASEAKWPIPRC